MALESISQRIPCYLHPTTLSSTIELFSMTLYCHKAEPLLPLVKPQYKATDLSSANLWSKCKEEKFCENLIIWGFFLSSQLNEESMERGGKDEYKKGKLLGIESNRER